MTTNSSIATATDPISDPYRHPTYRTVPLSSALVTPHRWGTNRFVVVIGWAVFAIPLVCSPNLALVSKVQVTASGHTKDDSSAHRERGDLALAARHILHHYCRECHSGPQTQGRFLALDYQQLTRADVAVPWVKPGLPAQSQIIQFLKEGSMPPANHPRPSDEEIDLLYRWIDIGAPPFPAVFDERYILEAIARDLTARRADTPFVRYVSLLHFAADRSTVAELVRWETELRSALRQCGIEQLEPIDAAATIFRYDVRAAFWHCRELFLRQHQGIPIGVYPLSPYDLILLDYPEFDRGQPVGTWPESIQKYLDAARMLRPVPYMRGDWLAVQLAASPLGDELRSLTALARELEQQQWPSLGREKETPCGPVPRPFHPLKFSLPPNSRLPCTAWYVPNASGSSLSPSFIAAELLDQHGQKKLDLVQKGQGFRLCVRTNKDIHFVLLMIWCTGHIEVQETNHGGFLKAGEHCLTPREADAFRIADILTGEQQTREYFLLLASSQPLPPLAIVRSRHAELPSCNESRRYPIERFFLEQQPTAVIERVLVPIPLRQ